MALHYDLTKIAAENREQYPPTEDGRMNMRTERLIFSTMSVGIGEITEKTEKEFFARLRLVEQLSGALAHENLTKPEDVHAHIGLTTNVFPMRSRAQWLKEVVSRMVDDNAWEFHRAMDNAARGAVVKASERKA